MCIDALNPATFLSKDENNKKKKIYKSSNKPYTRLVFFNKLHKRTIYKKRGLKTIYGFFPDRGCLNKEVEM